MNDVDFDAWAKDVIEWTTNKLKQGRVNEVVAQLDDVVTAVTIATRQEYRKDILELIRAMLDVLGRNLGR